MLALQELLEETDTEVHETEPGTFQRWYALLVEPNREERSAKMLVNLDLMFYLPMYMGQRAVAYGGRRASLRPVMPGLLFVPEEFVDVPRRDEIFALAHIRGFIRTSDSRPGSLDPAGIECIRGIEAKLNLPPPATPANRPAIFRPGQKVRFVNPLYAAFWGIGVVLGLAGRSRISIEVQKLFGCPTKVDVPASEIEVM
jgi:transcription antitermination factor NusG